MGENQRHEVGEPDAHWRERSTLQVGLVLKCRQLDYVKNLLASPPGPNLSSNDKDALARYRRVFDTFDGEIAFVMSALDETRKGRLPDEDLRRAVDTAGTLMKALWPT